MELETLKTYIKIWPIRPSKSPARPSILFLLRKTEAFDLPIIGKPWNCLGRTIRFFYPVGSDRRVSSEEHSWKATIWRQPSGPVTVTSSIKPCAFRPLFRPTATLKAPTSTIEACCFHQDEDRFLKISLSPSHYWSGFSRILTPFTSMLKTLDNLTGQSLRRMTAAGQPLGGTTVASQPLGGTTAAGQSLGGTTAAGQSLGRTTAAG